MFQKVIRGLMSSATATYIITHFRSLATLYVSLEIIFPVGTATTLTSIMRLPAMIRTFVALQVSKKAEQLVADIAFIFPKCMP